MMAAMTYSAYCSIGDDGGDADAHDGGDDFGDGNDDGDDLRDNGDGYSKPRGSLRIATTRCFRKQRVA